MNSAINAKNSLFRICCRPYNQRQFTYFYKKNRTMNLTRPVLLVGLFCFLGNLAWSQAARIEPPNWWVGMKNPNVQLLVHAPGIGGATVEINHPGVVLERSVRVKSPNYLFLDLRIEATAKPGNVAISFKKNGQATQTEQWPLLQRQAAVGRGFGNEDVIYLLTPDRFANGDPTNDEVPGMKEKPNRQFPGGRHGGDIEGIRQHLGYIADMGFTAIWPMPLVENDMPEYSYHGYAITDFYRVDPRYGSNDSFRQMVAEARKLGLKTIMDMVINHCGSAHWWMNDPPSDDWLNHWDKYTETNHRKSTLQDPYVSDIDKKTFTDGWFVPAMPDLNQRNPLMATYLTQNCIWWVEYAGLAGIRMDTYPYPDMGYMAEWSKRLMEEFPDLNIVGEEWNERPATVAYWQQGKTNPNGYVSHLKSLFDFPLQMALSRALATPEGWLAVYEMLAQDYLYAKPNDLVTLVDNHDMPRFFAQVGEDVGLFSTGLAFLLTTRGTPQIYYGTEVLMSSPRHRDDGIIRSDFPGGWHGDKANAFTGEGLTGPQRDVQAFLKKLLHWRQSAAAVQSGTLRHFDPKDGVYVYFRYTDQQRVMVVLNKNEKDVTLPLDRFAEMLNGFQQGRDVLSGRQFDLQKNLPLSAKTPLILELSKI